VICNSSGLHRTEITQELTEHWQTPGLARTHRTVTHSGARTHLTFSANGETVSDSIGRILDKSLAPIAKLQRT
jgi:hypothetical protein